MNNINIGKKILSFRHKNHMAIRDFSKISNLSPALISQLERGKGNPSLNALVAIANALGVSLSSLVEEEIPNSELILYSDNRKEIFNDTKGCRLFDILPNTANKNSVSLRLIKLEPLSSYTGNIFSDEKKECIIFVMEGTLSISFDNENYILKEGDTIIILPDRNYTISNNSDKKSIFMAIKSNN